MFGMGPFGGVYFGEGPGSLSSTPIVWAAGIVLPGAVAFGAVLALVVAAASQVVASDAVGATVDASAAEGTSRPGAFAVGRVERSTS